MFVAQQVAAPVAAGRSVHPVPPLPLVPQQKVHKVHCSVKAAAAAADTAQNGVAQQPSLSGNGNGHGSAAAPAAPAHSKVYQTIQETVSYIQSRCSLQPQVVMVLGSGLGPIADAVQDATVIPYGDIPHFHAPGVQGHPGRLVMGHFNGVPALVLQGRFHYYEGHPMEEVIFPIRVARFLGCHTAILTNAAGGINHDFHLGDLMVITDHLNLMTANPLRGPNPPELGGPRFLDLSEPYDRSFVQLLQREAQQLGFEDAMRTGTYAAVSGPTYETPAETRMLRAIGADAVGMSTVPEVIAARHVGVRVVGISCITNLACGISHDGQVAKVSHEEVMENINLGVEKMRQLLLAAVPKMAAQHAQVAAAAASKQ
ncbi:hypothetical protein OEZ85_012123 [Tetradesmus obliquus]|uniref:purine-nucleoside phosphorylase n=1 Tax=Tetradesmus obliquus TaxID=3088 RepID=A0ABY8TSD2_TETOB|nr:hypothetical protein OEZ85_012123 [Tetradesmus obliquus]